MAQLRYWVWLSALKGLSARAAAAVIREFGTPYEVYFAPYGAFEGLEGVTEKDAAALSDKSLAAAERILGKCEEKGIRILTIADAEYPLRLLQIYDPPQVLYLRGRLPYLDDIPAVAIVGTRKASPYGEKMARQLGYQLVKGGAAVITGMALGNDGAAARGALEGGGRCVGVLGTAIDNDYPRQNATLIADVASSGCILSEYPPGADTFNFPARNRIISGLSAGVCVVEAPLGSGALITANDALEQGRDLFAVPGNADNPNCAGSNGLLREGAKAVMSGADILEEYAGLFPVRTFAAGGTDPYAPEVPVNDLPTEETPEPEPNTAKKDKKTAKELLAPAPDPEERMKGCSEDQKKLLRLLLAGEKQADELVNASGFGPAKVMAEMTILSIRGLVSILPGKRFAIK